MSLKTELQTYLVNHSTQDVVDILAQVLTEILNQTAEETDRIHLRLDTKAILGLDLKYIPEVF